MIPPTPKMGSLKGYDIDSKDALLEAVRVYHIHSNVEYRIETSNQTSLSLKCKKGCSWKLRARLNPYSTSWFISKYNGKHGFVCWVVTLCQLDIFT